MHNVGYFIKDYQSFCHFVDLSLLLVGCFICLYKNVGKIKMPFVNMLFIFLNIANVYCIYINAYPANVTFNICYRTILCGRCGWLKWVLWSQYLTAAQVAVQFCLIWSTVQLLAFWFSYLSDSSGMLILLSGYTVNTRQFFYKHQLVVLCVKFQDHASRLSVYQLHLQL